VIDIKKRDKGYTVTYNYNGLTEESAAEFLADMLLEYIIKQGKYKVNVNNTKHD